MVREEQVVSAEAVRAEPRRSRDSATFASGRNRPFPVRVAEGALAGGSDRTLTRAIAAEAFGCDAARFDRQRDSIVRSEGRARPPAEGIAAIRGLGPDTGARALADLESRAVAADRAAPIAAAVARAGRSALPLGPAS